MQRRYMAYFGYNANQYLKRLPAAHVSEDKTPIFLAMAEHDLPTLASDTPDLAARICRRDGKCPPMVVLKGHNHLSEIMDIGTADQTLGRLIVKFIIEMTPR